MTQRITLQPAFVLHTRPFRDTSLLVEFFTLEYGRISTLARGARTKYKGQLRPFIPLQISWSGRTELMSLSQAEIVVPPYHLVGTQLISGLYLNEILMHLLHRHDPHVELYQIYQLTLEQLQQSNSPEPLLRLFEKRLLAELGYGLPLTHDAITQAPIKAEYNYRFDPERGFIAAQQADIDSSAVLFSGKSLLAFNDEELTDLENLRAIKRLTRFALSHLLGNKAIRSRELFVKE